MTELGGGARALGVVTGLTGDGEVAHPVGAMAHLGDDVLDLQGDVGGFAVGARPPPLLEQILSDLVAHQFPLLIFDSGDLGVLQEVGIEFDQFERERADWTAAAYSVHPRHHMGEAALQRGRQPTTPPPSIEEARRAIARVALAA
jgi:hypothetical protein